MSDELHAELRAMIERASVWAGEHFDQHGEISGMWHAVCEDGQQFAIDHPRGSKDFAADMVRVLFRAAHVIRCIYIDEAWIAHIGVDELDAIERRLAAGGSLETQPGRQEMVIFSGEDEYGALTAHRSIERPADGKPYLGPLTIDPPSSEARGRLVGVLPRRGQAAH
jgi:hypothetical protein